MNTTSSLRNSLRRLALLAVALIACTTAQAETYQWSRYNLSFETPEHGFVTYRSNTRFEIRWDDMVMTVQLYTKDKGDDKKLLQNNLKRKASGYNMYDTDFCKIKVKGFKTYCLEGTMPDGSRAIIADLVSKKQNLIVEITVNYLFGNRDDVETMIKSFAENKDLKPNHEQRRQKVQSREDAEKQEKLREQQRLEQEKKRRKANEKLYDA